ncbi:MAG: DUF4129 domain-containing protein [Gammaproteobacteria bacterium]|nr:DUF4129 domain-containing protein [Gammaproteobacteria bacterium]
MNLEDLQIVARPRNHWEALDLGLLIARRWYRLLLTSWLCFALPVFGCCWMLLPDSPLLAIFVVWWLKPVYERIPLKILSSAIFGSVPTLRGALRETRKCVFPGILSGLTYRRFSPNRSFAAPVLVLEGLDGEVRRKRLEVLQPKAGSAAFWLTLLGLHIEGFLIFGLIVGIYFFIPAELEIDWWSVIVGGSSGEQDWFVNGLMFMAMAVVAPVYVSAGFALYLNRRIELEAWDIELGFKRLAQRARAAMHVLSTLVVVGLIASFDTHAVVETDLETVLTSEFEESLRDQLVFEVDTLSDARRESRTAVENILAGADFHNETTTRFPEFLESLFEPRDEQPDQDVTWVLDFIRFVAGIAEVLLWAFVAIAVLWIAHRVRLLEKIGVLGHRGRRSKYRPTEIMGLSVTRSSLPEDVMGSAREEWRNGRCREAISLIYRASLSTLIHDFHCEFKEGDTEGDCLRKAPRSPGEVAALFRKLTRIWLLAAYAHQMPAERDFSSLCDQWSRVFDMGVSGMSNSAETG